MRSRPSQALPYLLAFVLGLGAAGLAACGDKTNPAMLPAANANELSDHLNDVLSAIESEECSDAQRAVDQVRSDLTSLPSGTSQRLEQRLKSGVERLAEQAVEDCQATATTETTTTATVTTPTTTTAVETTATETTPVETTPVETTPVETTPVETVPPISTVPPEDTGGEEAP